MTEEQRWKVQHQIEVDRNEYIKGILDELKNIEGLLKIHVCVSPSIAGTRLTENDLTALVKALEKPAQFVPMVEDVPEPPMPDNVCGEKLADVFKYDDWKNARFNGEYHGESIDPSDPSRK